jgi:hypothetical protein
MGPLLIYSLSIGGEGILHRAFHLPSIFYALRGPIDFSSSLEDVGV